LSNIVSLGFFNTGFKNTFDDECLVPL